MFKLLEQKLLKSNFGVQFRMLKKDKDKILKNLYFLKSFGYRYIDNIDISSLNFIDESNKIDPAYIKNCNLCDLSKSCKEKIPYLGDKNSNAILISTAPIVNNNELDLLKKMVQNVLKIPFNSLYFLHIIKCNVDNISKISNEHINICKKYIEAQLDTSDAKLIITLGDSYNILTNDKTAVANIRGRVLKYKNKDLIAIYHPDFLLRNPSFKKDSFYDLKKIKSVLERV